MKPVWLLWWSCLSLCGHCSPGVVMRVTQKWMDYILSEGTEIFRHILQHDRLPNITGSTRVFGMVDYAITGICVEEFDTSHTVAVLTPPTDIQLNVDGAMAKVFGQWRVKHWLINDNGNFSLRISGVTLKAQFTTFKDSAARPSVSLSSCHSEVKNAKVHLSGGASWLYNLFTGFLEKPIGDNLNSKLCPRVNEVIKILQKELATYQGVYGQLMADGWHLSETSVRVTVDLDANNKIDYALINPPRVQKTHIDLDLKGTIHHSGAHEQQEAYIAPFTLPETTQSMVLVGLSEYFFNAVGKNYFMSDIIKLTLTQEQYPHAFWLRTGDYGSITPEMKKYYPESHAVILTIKATKPPVILLTSQITMQIEGILEALVGLPYVFPEQLFAASVQATFIADTVRISNLNLKVSFFIQREYLNPKSWDVCKSCPCQRRSFDAYLTKFHPLCEDCRRGCCFHIGDIRSSVGHVDVSELEHSLGHMLQESIVHAVNSGLSSGIPMPTLANVNLQESAISITPGCLLMSMDMYYIPWRERMIILP